MAFGLCLLCSASPAQAENWVRVVDNPGGNATFVDVDADSIRTEADGLVYYYMRDDWDQETVAVNCQTRVRYTVDQWKRDGENWRDHPYAIEGINVDVADFVCARAT